MEMSIASTYPSNMSMESDSIDMPFRPDIPYDHTALVACVRTFSVTTLSAYRARSIKIARRLLLAAAGLFLSASQGYSDELTAIKLFEDVCVKTVMQANRYEVAALTAAKNSSAELIPMSKSMAIPPTPDAVSGWVFRTASKTALVTLNQKVVGGEAVFTCSATAGGDHQDTAASLETKYELERRKTKGIQFTAYSGKMPGFRAPQAILLQSGQGQVSITMLEF